MYKVSIARCTDYQYKNVEKSVFQCLDGMPEIKQKIKAPAKVLIKANLVSNKKPEEAVTTHPSVIQAIVKYFQMMGCSVIIGDSPGAPHGYNERTLNAVYKATGMMDVTKNTGCELNYDTSSLTVINEKARCLKEMSIIKIVNDVDYVISAAKLKTHTMMMYTGAVKNLFGVIPGIVKMKYHFTMKDASTFAEHLVDICEYVKPTLSIIDAVVGMEGNGPSGGDIREMGLIMGCENPYALDMAATHIVGINPFDVPTISSAIKRNLFTGDIMDIQTVGVRLEDINIKPFKLPDTAADANAVPAINHSICKSCGECKKICPPQAIDIVNGEPVIDLDKCIKCFCCHELCPENAVYIEKFYKWDLSKWKHHHNT